MAGGQQQAGRDEQLGRITITGTWSGAAEPRVVVVTATPVLAEPIPGRFGQFSDYLGQQG
jgi:hypothetical protein